MVCFWWVPLLISLHERALVDWCDPAQRYCWHGLLTGFVQWVIHRLVMLLAFCFSLLLMGSYERN